MRIVEGELQKPYIAFITCFIRVKYDMFIHFYDMTYKERTIICYNANGLSKIEKIMKISNGESKLILK